MSATQQTDRRAQLERLLNPRVVAVVGDKQISGYNWLKSLKSFSGHLYSVQIDPDELGGIAELGVANYPSLTEIPEPVDYVVCAVPRQVAPHIVTDCIAAQVGGVTLFTSGFAETAEELGIQLQAQIQKLAMENDLMLIGPNCMGLHIPKLGVRFNADQPEGVSGDVGFISQSGTHGMNFSLSGAVQGIYASKLISFGNAIVLEASDFLEYLTDDAETKIIGMYLEGVRDGPRFFRALRAAARRKPVVTWKGGQTAAGSRATQSHTASLATNQAVWDAMVRQAGAVSVDSLDEMLDVVKGLRLTKPARGRRIGLMAMTGGQSVVITDAFAKAGWEVPALSDASYASLGEFFNTIGGSYRNPLDMAGTISQNPAEFLTRILTIMERDPNLDALAVEVSAGDPVATLESQSGGSGTLSGRAARRQGAVRQGVCGYSAAGARGGRGGGPAHQIADTRDSHLRQFRTGSECAGQSDQRARGAELAWSRC